MSRKRILMLVGDFVEDYEVMVPFQMLLMVSHEVHTVPLLWADCLRRRMKRSRESVVAFRERSSFSRTQLLPRSQSDDHQRRL